MKVKFELEGLDDVIRNLKKGRQKLANEVKKEIALISEDVAKDARRRVKQDTLETRDSIEVEVTQNRWRLQGVIKAGGAAEYITRGRRPDSRPPPLWVMAEWAARHGMPRSAAYHLAKRIGERGIKPAPFLQPALDKHRASINPRLERAVVRAAIQMGLEL